MKKQLHGTRNRLNGDIQKHRPVLPGFMKMAKELNLILKRLFTGTKKPLSRATQKHS